MIHYSLAVHSRVPLVDSASLSESAYLLGKEIAAKGQTLLSPVGLNLAHRVAAGASDKSGLSIGFSPASGRRDHVSNLQLPTDVYDWLYFSNLKQPSLLATLTQSSQALILVGGVMSNLSELAMASDALLPVGILLDAENQQNNGLLQYLRSLPLEKQRHIVVHQDPKVLLETILKMVVEAHAGLDEEALLKNDRMFIKLLQEAAKVDSPAKADAD